MPKKILSENALYVIENKEYGKFYFTNLNLVSEFINGDGPASRTLIEYNMMKGRDYKGWKIYIIEDGGNILWKRINCTRDVLEEMKKEKENV